MGALRGRGYPIPFMGKNVRMGALARTGRRNLEGKTI